MNSSENENELVWEAIYLIVYLKRQINVTRFNLPWSYSQEYNIDLFPFFIIVFNYSEFNLTANKCRMQKNAESFFRNSISAHDKDGSELWKMKFIVKHFPPEKKVRLMKTNCPTTVALIYIVRTKIIKFSFLFAYTNIYFFSSKMSSWVSIKPHRQHIYLQQ